jgi:hypothetical protein
MHLSEFTQHFKHEHADILLLKEEVARIGSYSNFFYAFCSLNGELYSVHVAYSMLPYYKMNTREFHRDRILLTRYAKKGTGYSIAEQVEIGPGEDPRVVSNGTRAYAVIIANKFSGERTILLDLTTRQLVPLRVNTPDFPYGKNWQPLLIGDELFIVHELVPYRLLRVDVKTGRVDVAREVDVDFKLPCFRSSYPMFRGGSNAICVGDKVFGLGRGTSQRYRHHPFFWSMDAAGHLELTFTNFFDQFYRCGYNIIDPTSLFIDGDDVFFGLCCTERDWAHTQLLTNFLIALRPRREGVTNFGLTEFFAARNNQAGKRGPNLDRHMFFCIEMPCATASEYQFGGRVSTGRPGHLVHGPYITAPRAGFYAAELSYLTKAAPQKRAGVFDVAVSWPDRDNQPTGLRTLASVDLEATNGGESQATLLFDTSDLRGGLLEFRVYVDEGVLMNAYHIRTWRETDRNKLDKDGWCGFHPMKR